MQCQICTVLIAEAAERAKREAEADDIRGSPPEPSQDFRLPKECIPELLLVWDFTQVKGCGLHWSCVSVVARQVYVLPQIAAVHQASCTLIMHLNLQEVGLHAGLWGRASAAAYVIACFRGSSGSRPQGQGGGNRSTSAVRTGCHWCCSRCCCPSQQILALSVTSRCLEYDLNASANLFVTPECCTA